MALAHYTQGRRNNTFGGIDAYNGSIYLRTEPHRFRHSSIAPCIAAAVPPVLAPPRTVADVRSLTREAEYTEQEDFH